jgi:hypothetical protein
VEAVRCGAKSLFMSSPPLWRLATGRPRSALSANGVSERSLSTGPESRARRYGSKELLNHWQTQPRPTEAMFQCQDTRLGALYTLPRRKQYGADSRR